VHFDVARGSILALLGSNGAGKTTVVKILSTLLKADAGSASVNGFDVATHAADVRESISLTGQFAAVDDILGGRENPVLVARLRHFDDPGTVADALLDRFALTDSAGGDVFRRHAPPPRHRDHAREDVRRIARVRILGSWEDSLIRTTKRCKRASATYPARSLEAGRSCPIHQSAPLEEVREEQMLRQPP
jgi:energy-coupling factor transporter ATP-binding protein EcfA2